MICHYPQRGAYRYRAKKQLAVCKDTSEPSQPELLRLSKQPGLCSSLAGVPSSRIDL